MIDSTYTVKPRLMKKFTPLPMDKYQVQITDINLVKQANPFKGGEEEDRLYKLLCVVEKKELKEEDLTEFSPITLIGQQIIVMVEVAGEWKYILGFQSAEKDLEPVQNADERAKEDQISEKLVEEVEDKELDELFKEEKK